MRGVVGLVVAAVFAGCAGVATEDAGGLADQLEGAELSSAKGLGCVRGVIVDEAIRPVAKAQVRINPGDRNTTTDGNGVFSFCELKPGTYFVSAIGVGLRPAQTSIDVQADGVHDVRIALSIDTSPVPYHRTFKHEAFMQAWGGIAQFFVEDLAPTGLCDCRLFVVPDPNVKTFVLEASWTTGPLGTVDDEWYWILAQTTGDGLNEAGYSTSPLLKHIAAEAADFEQGSEVYYRQDGPDLAIESEQRFTMYLTVFYNQAAPAGWSFLGGSA